MLYRIASIIAAFSLLAGVALLDAQSNARVDELLAEQQATLGDAAYLALSAAGLIPEDASVDQALAVVKEKGWKMPAGPADAPIRLGHYAFLLMQVFEVKGGLMYGLFPGPRYAARELAYLRLIPARPVPGRKISGNEVMHILGSLLEWKGRRS